MCLVACTACCKIVCSCLDGIETVVSCIICLCSIGTQLHCCTLECCSIFSRNLTGNCCNCCRISFCYLTGSCSCPSPGIIHTICRSDLEVRKFYFCSSVRLHSRMSFSIDRIRDRSQCLYRLSHFLSIYDDCQVLSGNSNGNLHCLIQHRIRKT